MSTADKLSYLNTTKTKIRESINLTGAGLTASDTFRSYAVKLQDTLMEGLTDPSEFIETIVENSDKDVATGTTLRFNAYSLWMEYSLLGNTTQETTLGTNYFNAYDIPSSSGITISNDGQTITMPIKTSGNGITGTGRTLAQICPTLKVGDSVYLKGETTSYYNWYIYLTGSNFLWNINSLRTITQSDLDSVVSLYGNRYSSGETFQVVLSNFRIVKNNSDGWEKFTYGASPNPNYPQNVNTVTGNQDIWVSGKNLCYRYEYYNSNAIYMYFHPQELPQTFTISIKAPKQLSSNLNVYGWVNGSTNLGRFGYLSFSQAGEIAHATYTLSDAYYNSIKSATGTCFFSLYLSGAGFDTTGTLEKGQIESGNYTSYEAYKGNTYSINLGKNIFDKTGDYFTYVSSVSQIDNGIRVTLTSSSSTTYCYVAKRIGGSELLGKTLTIQANMSASSTNTTRVYLTLGNSTNPARSLVKNMSATGNMTSTLTSSFPTNCDGVYLLFYGNVAGTATQGDYVDYTNFQVELGSQATSYAPYFTPIELCKIGNYQDKIFKNTLTSPYYDSNLELDKWYLYKAIGKQIFSSCTYAGTNGSGETSYQATLGSISSMKSANWGDGYSNYFVKGTTKANNKMRFGANDTTIYIYTNDSNFASTSTANTWLSTHNTSVYYVLATPTTTEITNETLLSELESVSLITGLNQINVSSENLPAILDIEYLVKE